MENTKTLIATHPVINSPSIHKVGLLGKCPKCGVGRVYSGLLTVVDNCSNCEFALKDNDVGDGPAYFASFIISCIIIAASLIIEFKYDPPVILHIILWPPLTVIGCIYLLRIIKGYIIALNCKYVDTNK